MPRESVKRVLRPIVRPVLRELEARLQLQLKSSLKPVDRELAALQLEIAGLRSQIWPARDLSPILQPLLGGLETRLQLQGEMALAPVQQQLMSLQQQLTSLQQKVGCLQQEVATLRSDIWHAKAIPLGNEILVGCRHLGLVYLVEADDALIGPRFIMDSEYEPETTAFLQRTVQATSVCIDVGANFGYFTCLMAKLAWQGRTMAFEPDPRMWALLRRNIFINWCERGVEAFNLAVGEAEGKLTLFRRIGRAGNTSIIRLTPEELSPFDEPPSEEFTVDCVPLDRYAPQLPRVDVVKIDVEGAESLVLAGMRELIRIHRPAILMEWSPSHAKRAGFDLETLAATIEGLGLVPHVIEYGGDVRPISFGQLVDLPYQNVLLKHRSSCKAS